MDSPAILKEMAGLFEEKIDENYSCKLQFDFKDSQESYVIEVKDGKVSMQEGAEEDVDVVLCTTNKTLTDIYQGKINAFTAAGKAELSDTAPLDWRFAGGFMPEKMRDLYFFLMHFFNINEPEKIMLGEEYSRKVHGGNAVALYYNPGFRSAWYMVKKGDSINEPGHVDPFHQAIIIIAGQGYAKIGNKEVEIKANESYYIPPMWDQVIWTEEDEPLVLIWLAWGERA